MSSSSKKLKDSFRSAFQGFKEVLVQEPNFKYMVVIAFFVLMAMFYFPTSKIEKAILLTVIFTILILELINSVFERFLDFLRPQKDERVRKIKDLMSAIVLTASLGSIIIGLIIFLPYFKIFQ